MITIIVNQILFLHMSKAFPVAEKVDSLNHICFSLRIFSVKNIDLGIEGKGKRIDISVIFKYCAVQIHDINL